jgi:hypothetical protein
MSSDRFDNGLDEHEHEHEHDEALRGALRAAIPEPPLDAVDWIGLHARIGAAARPLLSRTQRPAPVPGWWQPLAQWSPRGIPLAAAASLLLVFATGTLGPEAATATSPAELFRTVEEELAYGAVSGSRPLLEGMGSEGILDVALFYDGEDW